MTRHTLPVLAALALALPVSGQFAGVPKAPGSSAPAPVALPGPSISTGAGLVDGLLIPGGPFPLEIAGRPLTGYPWFEFVTSFRENRPVYAAFDLERLRDVPRGTYQLWITEDRTPTEWVADPMLVDVRGASQTVDLFSRNIAKNVVMIDAGGLSGDAGTGYGVGYDVVLDVDGDGTLSSGDVVDGFGPEAGFYVVRDPNQDGPLAVTETSYFVNNVKAGFTGENLFYPTDIADLGELPLVVVSHGNGHNYNWYDHIGLHLASYGYVVMSHQNDTGPGVETASTTTLQHTEAFLTQLATIENGALVGHVDSKNIVWIGHSRGGEGVVRAYDRLFDASYEVTSFRLEDIRGVISMAPTTFLAPMNSNPHMVPYHLFTAAADNDVTGCANLIQGLTFKLYERANGDRSSTYLHGVGHGALHNGPGGLVANGPCKVGRPNTQQIQRQFHLALVKAWTENNPAARDFLSRPYAQVKSTTASNGPCIGVYSTYQLRAQSANRYLIDNFKDNPETTLSSSGGLVSNDLDFYTEDGQGDPNSNFTHADNQPTNGMTYQNNTGGGNRGAFLGWTGPGRWAEWEIPVGRRDVTEFDFLSFRAGQMTRHPQTLFEDGPTTFRVGLRDEDGNWSAVDVGAYEKGLAEPYQRTGCGVGTGWTTFFETVRIRLSDLRTNGRELDLQRIEAIRFVFGRPGQSPVGRIALDDLEFVDA